MFNVLLDPAHGTARCRKGSRGGCRTAARGSGSLGGSRVVLSRVISLLMGYN